MVGLGSFIIRRREGVKGIKREHTFSRGGDHGGGSHEKELLSNEIKTYCKYTQCHLFQDSKKRRSFLVFVNLL